MQNDVSLAMPYLSWFGLHKLMAVLYFPTVGASLGPGQHCGKHGPVRWGRAIPFWVPMFGTKHWSLKRNITKCFIFLNVFF